MTAEINALATYSKKRDLYREIKGFMRGYQLRTNLIKDKNRDLLTDFHNIFNRWKNYFSVTECP
jgi:hypothetical protein